MLYEIYWILYYVGTVVGLFFVFGKAGVARWKALIPIYHFIPWVELCVSKKKVSWYIGLLLPAINIFVILLLVVETAKCFRRNGFFEQLLAVIFPWAYMPLMGLSRWEYHNPVTDPSEEVSEGRDWLDAIAFAVVAALIIRGNVVEFYHIPSSSMEKSLMVGDFLLVSKVSYGPRVAMTPLSVPFVHNVLPGTDGQVESFSRLIQLPYHRHPGLGKVERFDALVFNYPEGDTACSAWGSNASYYDLLREMGREELWNADKLNVGGLMKPNKIRVRPVDKRENFIKRCIGLPGEDLQILNQAVYINGKPILTPKNSQQTYLLEFNQFKTIDEVLSILEGVGVSEEDISSFLYRFMNKEVPDVPLTDAMVFRLNARPDLKVTPRVYAPGEASERVFPKEELENTPVYQWTWDNFGPIHIPAKGETIHLDLNNIPLYYRAIRTYEGNEVVVKDSTIYINGVPADSYTFKMNYYWAMGDNRHNSADSRAWGFVPEDHIVGKGTTILFSIDKEKNKIRWDRCFRNASRID